MTLVPGVSESTALVLSLSSTASPKEAELGWELPVA